MLEEEFQMQTQLLFIHKCPPLVCFSNKVLQDLHLEFYQSQMTKDGCQIVLLFVF